MIRGVNTIDAGSSPLCDALMNTARRRPLAAFLYGAPIGTLGGLIGLGGAEFRLPVLKASFGYPLHAAVALNLAVSLVTLLASLVLRVRTAPTDGLAALAPIMLAIIAGSMAGAFVGASYASRLSVARLERLIQFLLVGIGLALMVEGFVPWKGEGVPFGLAGRVPLGIAAGVGIGLVSSMLGVAGGELIIPTLVFAFGADIKLAGTASVIISLPTVMVGLARYAKNGAFADGTQFRALVAPMGAGSILGAMVGAQLVPYVPSGALKFALGVILIVSAVRIFRHTKGDRAV